MTVKERRILSDMKQRTLCQPAKVEAETEGQLRKVSIPVAIAEAASRRKGAFRLAPL